jgi:ribosomal protein L19
MKGGEAVMHVYLVTFKEAGTNKRQALELTSMKEAVEAILFLDADEVSEVEIFRAEPVTV